MKRIEPPRNVYPARCIKAVDQLKAGQVYSVTLAKPPHRLRGEPGEVEVKLNGLTRTYSRGFFEAVHAHDTDKFPRIKRAVNYDAVEPDDAADLNIRQDAA